MDNPKHHLPWAMDFLAPFSALIRQQAKDLQQGAGEKEKEKEQEKEHITPLFIMVLVFLAITILGAIGFLLIQRNS